MKKEYDIAIVGAGPAGLMAARNILSQDKNIALALIDKSTSHFKNIICGEGVYKLPFQEIIVPQKEWIRFIVPNLVLHSPNNTTVTYVEKTNVGYIIDRSKMQSDLLKESLLGGADVLLERKVREISGVNKNGTRTIRMKPHDTINARVVIDCSGILNKFAHQEDIICKPHDLEIGYCAHLKNVQTDCQTIHMYIGQRTAPGGYAWVFPRTDNAVNVGIVIANSFLKNSNLKKLLHSFITQYYPQAIIEKIMAKPIACFTKRYPLTAQGLIKAGDAASMINPIKRSGITEAMMSGNTAGQFALEMLTATSLKSLIAAGKGYERVMYEKLNRSHAKLAKVKNIFNRIPDHVMDRGAELLKEIPSNELTISRIFTTTIKKYPSLLWALRYYL